MERVTLRTAVNSPNFLVTFSAFSKAIPQLPLCPEWGLGFARGARRGRGSPGLSFPVSLHDAQQPRRNKENYHHEGKAVQEHPVVPESAEKLPGRDEED